MDRNMKIASNCILLLVLMLMGTSAWINRLTGPSSFRHSSPGSLRFTPLMASIVPDASSRVLGGLEPQSLWHFFEDLSNIPRPSKHEEKVLEYLKAFADSRGLSWQQDRIGNMVIRKPGMNGGEKANPVVIQGHVDMVCEKNTDTTHDFLKDPLRLLIDGDWVTADGTTLGSDNGIGVAAALALLDMDPKEGRKLPPLEALFTVDEETGLTGAFDLDASMLEGRTMLNLDTEEWGALYVGCAGGGESTIDVSVTRDKLQEDYRIYTIRVDGLLGGHSGININEDRANAIRVLAGILDELSLQHEIKIVSIEGGDKHNAIPREAWATIAVKEGSEGDIYQVIQEAQKHLISEYGVLEVKAQIHLTQNSGVESLPAVLAQKDADALISLLLGLPNGVIKYSHDIENLVETSNNIASIKPSAGEGFQILCSTRSSLGPAMEKVRRRISRIAQMCGAEVSQPPAYPGWQPNLDSDVLKLAQTCASDILGRQPEVLAIHAGLECGILGEKVKGMDMISMGPTITGAHSPDERVQISTVRPFWNLTLGILEKLAIPVGKNE